MRTHNQLSKDLVSLLSKNESLTLDAIYEHFPKLSSKSVYDALYRLQVQGYVEFAKKGSATNVILTEDGFTLCTQQNPERDGVWKLIIFDIPESKRPVRDHIRGKLKGLGFKKWQTSIWVSPYKLAPEIEKELGLLAEKFFVRLIKTTEINYLEDLEKLFPD